MPYKPIEAGLHNVLSAICTTYNRFAKQAVGRPYITYHRISTTREETLQGNAGIATARMQISCFHDTAEGVSRTANSVRLAMLNQQGATWGDHLVFGMKLDNQLDVEDPSISVNGTTGLYSQVLDYLITYQEEADS